MSKKRGNGEGSIYYSERLNRWVGQFTAGYKEDGSINRKSVYGKTRKEVSEKIIQKQSEVNNNTFIDKSDVTLYDILKKHIEQKFEDGMVSPRSYLRDKQTLKEIEKSCYTFIYMSMQKISIEDIENAKKYIREYSQNTIDKIWRFLSKSFKIAYSRRKIQYNVMDNETLIKPISKKQTKKIEALNSKELDKLNEVLNTVERKHKYRNIVKMQLETGMRIGEVLARSMFDIDFKKNSMIINNTLTTDEKGKTIIGDHTKTYNKMNGLDSGVREINMNKAVKEIVIEQKQNKILNIYNLLFWDYKNNTFISYTEINSWLNRINEKYNISQRPLTSHVLRHTRITEMRKMGVDMKVIQYIVGHVEGSKITDDIYTSVTPEFIEQEMNKINNN